MPTREDFTNLQYLYLTTTGRVTNQPREIEIWFVQIDDKFYILAEQFNRAQWVQNILRTPRVRVRLGDRHFDATARVLNEQHDAIAWQRAQQLAHEKYGWGDGLPVEITLQA